MDKWRAQYMPERQSGYDYPERDHPCWFIHGPEKADRCLLMLWKEADALRIAAMLNKAEG